MTIATHFRPDSSRADPRLPLRGPRASLDGVMSNRPYFLWDVDVTEEQLRDKLKAKNADARAQWQGWVMAEARFADVWKYISLAEVLRDWPHIRRHLGRSRAYWEFLLDGWRRQGLIHG